jgi:hypothetical protein
MELIYFRVLLRCSTGRLLMPTLDPIVNILKLPEIVNMNFVTVLSLVRKFGLVRVLH